VRLQRAKLQRQRIDVAARRRLEIVDDLLLHGDVAVQRAHFIQGGIARIGNDERQSEADRRAAGSASRDRGADLQPRPPELQVE